MAIITKDRYEEMENRREIFKTNIGRKYLVDQIISLGVFDTISPGDTEALARRNYGLALMYDLGLVHDGIIGDIVDKLFQIDYRVGVES